MAWLAGWAQRVAEGDQPVARVVAEAEGLEPHLVGTEVERLAALAAVRRLHGTTQRLQCPLPPH